MSDNVEHMVQKADGAVGERDSCGRDPAYTGGGESEPGRSYVAGRVLERNVRARMGSYRHA
jgi:hypothetical protein